MSTISPNRLCGQVFRVKPNRERRPVSKTCCFPRKNLKNYFKEAKDMLTSDGGGAPPRWFSPLECGVRSNDSPLLLFLPGIDGVGLGLIRQHQTLGKMFDIWCLHIPPMDRTKFQDLVEMVEISVRSENDDRPIYLVGESLGACIALAVAARNPDVDFVLILANPATSSGNNSVLPLAKLIPDQLNYTIPLILNLMTGAPLKMAVRSWIKGFPTQQLYQAFVTISNYNSVLADILPKETLVWKLQMLQFASAFVNQHLHHVTAQTLVLTSGSHQFLSSKEEAKRLRKELPKCDIRSFQASGPFFFLEDGIDLASIIKGTYLYRRQKNSDFVSDYIPMTTPEFNKINASNRFLEVITGTVMLSTSEDGNIIRGLGGIPSDGPVLVVGNHMLMGCDLISIPGQLFIEQNIILRGLAHPFMFSRLRDGFLPPLSFFDKTRILGAVPVTPNHLYKLLSSGSHVLLYPGGLREAMHRKNEECKLNWPEDPEFIRMSIKFGAKIIPFGVIGEDDFFKVCFDYNDQMKNPLLRWIIENLASEAVELRTDSKGEAGNQHLHVPGVLPKPPGRVYYYFGKPIDTKGWKNALSDKEECRRLYLEVKSEVEKCIAFLREKRKQDPYRGLLARLKYQVAHGFGSQVPTFHI